MELLKEKIKENSLKFTLSILCAVISTIINLLSYIFLSVIVRKLVLGVNDLSFYKKQILYIVLLLILKELFANISTSISHEAAFKSLRDIRRKISDKLFVMPLGEVLRKNSGTLKNIIIDQVDHCEMTLAHIVPEVTSNIIGPILLLIYMFTLDYRLTLLSLIPLALGMLSIFSIMNKDYKENYQKSVKLGQRMNDSIVEYINGVEVIKAFNQKDSSYKKFRNAVYDNARLYYDWMKSCNIRFSTGRMLSPMGLITIIPFGILFYLRGSLDLATFISLIVLSFGTVEGVLKVMNYMDDMARISTIFGEVEGVLNSKELIRTDKKLPKTFDIEFKNVDFSYEKDEKVIDNLNLNITSGTAVALVGPSGSGKSTITKLLAGFFDVDKGDIRIGNVSIKDISLEKLSELISYVSQDNYLFDMSVMDNIRVGKPDATDEEVIEVIKKSGCYDFIKNLKDSFYTVVGEGGCHLSGGEKQRISIARAMIKDTPIVILDEATSYIDPENEGLIQDSISKLVKGKTLIMIAHRLRTITDVDKIFLIKDGRLEDSGSHLELLDKSVVYQNMFNALMKGENND